MHPAASPCLISDWDYHPTAYFGALVMTALRGEAVPIPPRATSAVDHVIYDGKLQNGFQSWSSAKVDLSAQPTNFGTAAMRVQAGDGQQLQLGTVPFDGLPYRSISLWLNGGATGGQALSLAANVMDVEAGKVALPTLRANQWTHATVSFDDLGIADKEDVKSFALRSADGKAMPAYLVCGVVVKGR